MKHLQNKYLSFKHFLISSNSGNFFLVGKVLRGICSVSLWGRGGEVRDLLIIIFFFQLVFKQMPQLCLSKKVVIRVRIKKGGIVGCKVEVLKKKLNFFLVFLVHSFNLQQRIQKRQITCFGSNCFTFSIRSFLRFSKIDFFFDFFSSLPPLTVNLIMNLKTSGKTGEFGRLLGFKF